MIMAQRYVCRMFSFSDGHHQIYLPITSNLTEKSPFRPELLSSSCVVEKEVAILSWQTLTLRPQQLARTDCGGNLASPDSGPLALSRAGSVSSRQGHLREFNHTLWLPLYLFLHVLYLHDRWYWLSVLGCDKTIHWNIVIETRDSISKTKQRSK